ncbi:MAG: hypothetical protein HQL57_07190 [Magnetococcales bacterium]|nr:hypothetical protein [Magnetococcales bacterium]
MKIRHHLRTGLLALPILLGSCLTAITAGAAAGGPGSCAQFDFSTSYWNKTLKWSGVARVLREDAPLYDDAKGNKTTGSLVFNQQAEILAEEGDRIEIRAARFQDRDEAKGWARKADLLCRNLPLKGDSGLENKFFIRTSTVARGPESPPPTVQVFQDPELKECTGGSGHCREGASRFHMYFIFDENEEAVLLADRFRLEDDDLLLGWVKKENGFLWNNAFSLRPEEDLKSPDKSGPGTVCSYEQLGDAVARNPDSCQPVEGGVEWFKSPLRIPVLDLVDANNRHVAPDNLSSDFGQRRFYKVALARPGLVGRPLGGGRFAVSAGLAKQIMPEAKSLSSKKNVDVFFLLDATASMEGVIDAVRGTATSRGVIQEIIHTLKNAQGFKGTQFRFGFRVYRDPYADKAMPGISQDGIGEGLPLTGECSPSPEAQAEGFAAFQKAIAGVGVTSEDQDDYQENLFGGLGQVLEKDITPCPDNVKILFAIGDNGYRSSLTSVSAKGKARTNSKYARPWTMEALAPLLRGSQQAGNKSNTVIAFFVQTPNRADNSKHPAAYNIAYRQFEEQARDLLKATLPTDTPVDDYFLRLGEEKLLANIVTTVEKLGSSALIDEIILDIRGGAALNSVIDRLRQERVDIPGIYWHILKKGACGELGEQCQSRVYDTTSVGFIEAGPEVVEELWVTSSELSSWIRILRGFEGYFDLPEAQLRKALISALILGLQQEIRRPPINVSGETPAEYAQRRGGLPVRRHSPLLSYNVQSLSAENTVRDKDGHSIVADRENKPILDKSGHSIPAVPTCELRRLALWAIKSKEMLEAVERDFNRPVYKTDSYQPYRCPDATPTGRKLLKIAGTIEQVPLGPSKEYRFGHTFGGRRGYWIPQEYLP